MRSDLASSITHMPPFRTEDFNANGALYIGIVLAAIIYGTYIGVYCLSILALLGNKNITRLHRNLHMSFSSVLLLLNTLSFFQSPYAGNVLWTMTRDYPGGPIAYFGFGLIKVPVIILGNITQILAVTLNDGLLAYRCYVVFGSRLYIIILSVICILPAVVLAMAYIPLLSNPEGPGLNDMIKIAHLVAVSIALDTAANVMVTAMISIKILSVSRELRKHTCLTVIPAHARAYTNIVTILVESAAPCAVLGILACIGTFLNTTQSTESTFGFSSEAIVLTWSMCMALFPQLIIYRVARGSAWTEKTSQELAHAIDIYGSRTTCNDTMA